MLVDTNIFIDFLKGAPVAKHFFEKEKNLSTSILCLMEIAAGLPKRDDIGRFELFLEKAKIKMYLIEKEISQKGYQLFVKYHHRSGLSIPDAFIAATALVYNEELVTLNRKHFLPLKEISLVKPY